MAHKSKHARFPQAFVIVANVLQGPTDSYKTPTFGLDYVCMPLSGYEEKGMFPWKGIKITQSRSG